MHKNTCTHDWHRHPFSRFYDFFPIKINYPWPKKCKMPCLIVAASSTCSLSVMNSLRSQWTQMFLPAVNGLIINSALLNYFNFQNVNFLLTLNKNPLLFHDHFLTCGNPGTCKHQYNKELPLSLPNRLNTKQLDLATAPAVFWPKPEEAP